MHPCMFRISINVKTFLKAINLTSSATDDVWLATRDVVFIETGAKSTFVKYMLIMRVGMSRYVENIK